MFKIIQRRRLWYGFSLLLIAASVVFLLLGGLRLGTDFKGGSLLQIRFAADRPPASELETIANENGLGAVRAQHVDNASALLRVKELTSEEHAELLAAIQKKFSGAKEEAYSAVGPTIGRELQQKAFLALFLVLLGIILYISIAFRKTSGRLSGWAFGVNAIFALIHDVVITVGFFAALGYFADVEVDALFVTAILTVLGFSVHDTIVVFDRARELLRKSSAPLEDILNDSVNATIIRSINTSLTTILVLSALYLFGGSSIHSFILALIAGITVGTYSSIFIASPLLLVWNKQKK